MAASRLSRRGFVGGVATALGAMGVTPPRELWSRAIVPITRIPIAGDEEEYDASAKLGNNENPYGPPESVTKAMAHARKYANRYGYPDGGIFDEIAKLHGVKRENILLAAGSGEILSVTRTAFLQNGRVLVGADPSYDVYYSQTNALKADIIKVPLLPDYRQDIPALLRVMDVFLLTSLWEGLPRVFPQAMCASLPIVATRVDGAPEAVCDGESGYLVSPRDCDSMARHILHLIGNEGLRTTMGEAGLRRVEPAFCDREDHNAWTAHQERVRLEKEGNSG